MTRRVAASLSERYSDDAVTLHLGDCVAVMAEMEPESVHAIVCDPPYDLTAGKKGGSGEASVNLASPYGRARITTGGGFMGQGWDATGVAFDPDTWRAAFRVLKPGGHLLAFGGTRTYHRMVCAIEDAGFEVRDCLVYLYGSGFPKSKNVALAIDKGEGHPNRGRAIPTSSSYQASDHERENKLTSNPVEAYSAKSAAAKSWEGYGTALKPAYEPIVLARKPLAGTVAANVLKHGTGALNIDGCRIEAIERPARAKDAKPEANGSVYAGRQKPGSGFDGGSKAVGTTDLGRWPANVVLDEEGAAMLDEQSGTLTSGSGALRRNADKFRTAYGVFTGTDEPADVLYGDSGGASRFFYTAKASRADRGEGNDHPTVKPVDLMRWLVRLVTAPGHVVLDPFAGSGTTLQACIAENRKCIGIEQDEHYCELILNRLGRPIQVSLL